MSCMVHEFSEQLQYWATGLSPLYHFQNRWEAVVAAPWIWTHLRDADATIRVAERDVPAEPHALVTALTGAG